MIGKRSLVGVILPLPCDTSTGAVACIRVLVLVRRFAPASRQHDRAIRHRSIVLVHVDAHNRGSGSDAAGTPSSELHRPWSSGA
jgi:hypothetical protein